MKILFRGKRVDGEWIEGGYFNTEKTDKVTKHFIVTYREGDSALTEWRIIPETLCQLVDEQFNVFIGDVFERRNGTRLVISECPWCLGVDLEKGKVIGNVHDNPELIR